CLQSMIQALMGAAQEQPDQPKVVAAAAQWGIMLRKDTQDIEPGVTIKKVLTNSPAQRAGLQAGDRLLTVDGRWTDSLPDVYRAAALARPGTRIEVTVQRRKDMLIYHVTPRPGI